MDPIHEEKVTSESCQNEKMSVSCSEEKKKTLCEECKIGFIHRRNFKQHLREKHYVPPYKTKRKSAFKDLVKQVSFYPRRNMFPHQFLDSIIPGIKNEVKNSLLIHGSVKWYMCSTLQVMKTGLEEHKRMFVRNHAVPIFSGSDLDKAISSQISMIMKKTADGELKTSGWIVERIIQVEVTIVRFESALSKK
jgi:hypothetical protein